ncbi:MAG: lipoprotein-releasing ABC transporter permease subunit [Pseudomonadota bacterium]
MGIEFFIAGRYLKAKRREGFISLITLLSVTGVTVGVMALVIVIAVMSGAENDFRKRILGVEPHIIVMNYTGKFSDYSRTEADLKETPGVVNVSPMVFGQTMIKTANTIAGAVIRGVDPATDRTLITGFTPKDLMEALKIGDPVTGEFPGIILGKELAGNLGVVKGDAVVLMAPGGMISPVGHIPSLKRFHVTGIFESGMFEYDNSLAYVHMGEAQKLMGMKDRISAMGIWVDDIFSADVIKKVIVTRLDYPYYARDWMEINQSLFSALKLEKTAMFIILTLIILVAAFNIASALIMMVMEKTRDIAVLKAMGATNTLIRNIFIFQGMIIGLFGTITGTFLGVGVSLLLQRYKFIELPAAYPFSTLPIQLESMDVFLIAASAILICFISTLYPSYKASRMNPVEGLRYG